MKQGPVFSWYICVRSHEALIQRSSDGAWLCLAWALTPKCNSREEPLDAALCESPQEVKNWWWCNEWRSSQVQTEPLHCCWRVLVCRNEIKWVNGLVNPSARPTDRPAAFPAADRWKCLQLGCVRFTAGWPRPSVTQSNSHLPPNHPPTHQPAVPSAPKISRYAAEMDSSSPPVPSSLFPLWRRCVVLTSHYHCPPQVLRAFFRLRFQAMQIATQR